MVEFYVSASLRHDNHAALRHIIGIIVPADSDDIANRLFGPAWFISVPIPRKTLSKIDLALPAGRCSPLPSQGENRDGLF